MRSLIRRLEEYGMTPNDPDDPVEIISDWAEEGGRVVSGGKTIWAGLGSRDGLHDYADQVLRDKWRKSGPRFVNKLRKLKPGTKVDLLRFNKTSRGRGKWLNARSVTL